MRNGAAPKEPPRSLRFGDDPRARLHYDSGPLLNRMLPLKVTRVSVGPPEPRVPCCWLGKMPVSGKSELIAPLVVLASTSAFVLEGTSTSTLPLNVVNARSRPQFARPIVAVTCPEKVVTSAISVVETVTHTKAARGHSNDNRLQAS